MIRKYGFLAGLDFPDMTSRQVVIALAELGYQAVSWPLARFDPYQTTHMERKHLIQTTKSAGLQISEWVLQLDYICLDKSERSRRIKHSKDVIRTIGSLDPSPPINIFTGPAPWIPSSARLGVDLSEGQAWSILDEVFEQLLPLAETNKVYLAVEGVFGHLVHDYYTSAELLRRYPSPSLGINFDPSHGILYNNDIPWAIRQLDRHIMHVHLKDAVGKPGGLPGQTFIFPLLGEGIVDWMALSEALDDIKYTGYLTVEFESFDYYQKILKNDPIAAAKISMQHIQKIFNHSQEN